MMSSSAGGGAVDADSSSNGGVRVLPSSVPSVLGEGQQQEMARLVGQWLNEHGFVDASAALQREARIERGEGDGPAEAFASAVIDGRWDVAAALLGSGSLSLRSETASNEGRFEILCCKYIDLLEARDIASALTVLREELSVLSTNDKRLDDRVRSLSSLLLTTSAEDVRRRAGVGDLSTVERRHRVLADIRERFVDASGLLPERRLETLVHQALQHQAASCSFHNPPSDDGDMQPTDFFHALTPVTGLSLLSDHECARGRLPCVEAAVLSGAHTDEVWYCKFGNTGRLLASAGKDATVCVWELRGIEDSPHTQFDVRVRCVLSGHTQSVSFLAFSADDSELLTCGNDNSVILWNIRSDVQVDEPESESEERCLATLTVHTAPVTSVAWFPDNESFVSGGTDKSIVMHSIERDDLGRVKGMPYEVRRWNTARVNDLCVTPDGRFMIAVCQEKKIRIYDMVSDTQEQIQETDSITSVSVSRYPVPVMEVRAAVGPGAAAASRRIFGWTEAAGTRYHPSHSWHILVNVSSHEIHCWDIVSRQLVQSYRGFLQSRYVIRSCFGGVNDAFIASGSEDSYIYVWRRTTGELVSTLAGHSGPVNNVAWNAKFPEVFASACDDCTVRVWTSSEGGT